MKLKACISILLLIIQTRLTQSKNILCLLGVGTETALKWNKIFLNELSARGNDLTVVTPVSWNAETESNIKFVHLENGMKFVKKRADTGYAFSNILQQSILLATANWYDEQMATCRGNLNSTGLSEVLNMALKEKRSFDMIIFDVSYGPGCLLPLTDLFSGIPIVGITSSTLTSNVLSINQNSVLNAVFDPYVLSDFGRVMNYWTRIYNTLLYGFDYMYCQWVVKPVLEGLWSHYTGMHDKEISIPNTLNDFKKRLKVILANHHPTLHTLSSLPYNVVPVPGLHIKTFHNLNLITDLSKFKRAFVNGIVLINLEMDQVGEFDVQTVLDVVGKFPKYGFIWKTDKTMNLIQNKLKNLIVEAKMENQEIFEFFKDDNSIKLMFTTPNILRIQECLFHGIPMITLALTLEQSYLAQRLKEQGVAISLPLSDLSKLAPIIESLLTNDTLQNTALQLKKSFVNQRNPSLDTAVWWVQHLLANPEANDYLFNASKDSFGAFAKTSLDIVLFFEVLVALCFVNTIFVWRQTIANFRKQSIAKKKHREKNESKTKRRRKERKIKDKIL